MCTEFHLEKQEGDTCQQWAERLVVYPPKLIRAGHKLGSLGGCTYDEVLVPPYAAIGNVCLLWGPGPENTEVERMSEAERIAAYAAIGSMIQRGQ